MVRKTMPGHRRALFKNMEKLHKMKKLIAVFILGIVSYFLVSTLFKVLDDSKEGFGIYEI